MSSLGLSAGTGSIQGTETPIKYLLQHSVRLNEEGGRGPEELKIIRALLSQSHVLPDYGVTLSEDEWKQLCGGVVLIYCESPHIMELGDNQLYLFLDGQGFEYMQNNWEGRRDISSPNRLQQDNEYVMLRKITANDYFLSGQEYNTRYHAALKKYQLMVDQQALIAKVSQQLYMSIFYPKVQYRQRTLLSFMRTIPIFQGLPTSFFLELSKFIIDARFQAGQKVLGRQEKNRWVSMVRKGEVEVRWTERGLARGWKGERVSEGGTFGMEMGDGERQVYCVNDCILGRIDKRLLAIVITSFEVEFQQRGKIWSEVNLNSQIKGQSHLTPEKILLLKNAQRIRTSERKARDLKLRYLSSSKKKTSMPLLNTIQQEGQQATNSPSRQASPEERRRMLKTSQGRYRSLTTFKNPQIEEARYSQIISQLLGTPPPQQTTTCNQIEITPLQSQKAVSPPRLSRKSNAFEYMQQLEQQGPQWGSRSLSKTHSHTFVPKLQAKPYSTTTPTKADSELIGLLLEKKHKRQIEKKYQKAAELHIKEKTAQQHNLKRLFNGRKSEGLAGQVCRNIAEDIVERMSHIGENPLLGQIQSERRRLQRRAKVDRQKVKEKGERKSHKQGDHLILIRNNQ